MALLPELLATAAPMARLRRDLHAHPELCFEELRTSDLVAARLAEWGVDYVKVDDLSRPYFQNQPEVEAIRRAIDKTGRPMVLSLSPGATDIRAADHVTTHANLWRISDCAKIFWPKRPRFITKSTIIPPKSCDGKWQRGNEGQGEMLFWYRNILNLQ